MKRKDMYLSIVLFMVFVIVIYSVIKINNFSAKAKINDKVVISYLYYDLYQEDLLKLSVQKFNFMLDEVKKRILENNADMDENLWAEIERQAFSDFSWSAMLRIKKNFLLYYNAVESLKYSDYFEKMNSLISLDKYFYITPVIKFYLHQVATKLEKLNFNLTNITIDEICTDNVESTIEKMFWDIRKNS